MVIVENVPSCVTGLVMRAGLINPGYSLLSCTAHALWLLRMFRRNTLRFLCANSSLAAMYVYG